MIYQKDWLMRQIESMIAAILHFLSHSSKQDHDVQISQSLSDEIDYFLERGDICGAENWIYENLDDQDIQWLRISVCFYGKLNSYSDEYLEEHNFSREEIISGLTDVSERFGFGHIL